MGGDVAVRKSGFDLGELLIFSVSFFVFSVPPW